MKKNKQVKLGIISNHGHSTEANNKSITEEEVMEHKGGVEGIRIRTIDNGYDEGNSELIEKQAKRNAFNDEF